MEPPSIPGRRGRRGEQGFTLAALIVILTILMVFVAYTVPRSWSTVLQRDRERQTIWIMHQYARAIYDFQAKHQSYPTTMDQLKEARQPRFLRGFKGGYADPLTGEEDWLLIPATAIGQQQLRGGPPPVPPPTTGGGPPPTPNPTPNQPTTSTDTTGTQLGQQATIPAYPMKDWAGGAFIGVRPNKTGKSFFSLNGADQYDQWNYTVIDYKNEVEARKAATAIVYP